MALENSVKDAREIERLLRRAESTLINIASTYKKAASCTNKQIILKWVLPRGAALDGTKLFELSKSLLFKVVASCDSKEVEMASPMWRNRVLFQSLRFQA